jgi:hypothetical protein
LGNLLHVCIKFGEFLFMAIMIMIFLVSLMEMMIEFFIHRVGGRELRLCRKIRNLGILFL